MKESKYDLRIDNVDLTQSTPGRHSLEATIKEGEKATLISVFELYDCEKAMTTFVMYNDKDKGIYTADFPKRLTKFKQEDLETLIGIFDKKLKIKIPLSELVEIYKIFNSSKD